MSTVTDKKNSTNKKQNAKERGREGGEERRKHKESPFSIMGPHLCNTSNYICIYAQREAWMLRLPGMEVGISE